MVDNLPSWVSEASSLAVFLAAILTASIAASSIFRRIAVGGNAFASYRIAVLGPPRSGKTTSLMAVLDQVGRDPVTGVARLRGETTIRSVERARQNLNMGKFPDPTREDESFVYRFDFSASTRPLQRALRSLASIPSQYRVEVADFAGEHSEAFFSIDGSSSVDVPREYSISTEINFLKWIAESDKCILYIDCAEYLERPKIYPGEISAKYMAFWDRYLDLIPNSLNLRGGPPVILLFTKIDLLAPDRKYDLNEYAVNFMSEEFSALIGYLDKQSRRFSIEAISVLIRNDDGEFAGVSDLVAGLLPLRYEGPSAKANIDDTMPDDVRPLPGR